MDTVIKTVNFICASAINNLEIVALFEEVENEFGEIRYHTNVKWLSWGSVSKRFLDMLNDIKFLMEKEGRNIEELKDEGRWM